MITIILTILLIIALGVMAWIVIPKLPQLSLFEIQQSEKDKIKDLKKHIIINRLFRRSKETFEKIVKKDKRDRFRSCLKDIYRNLKLLEDKYRNHTSESKIELLLKRGNDNINDDLEAAEQCFLDVINIDKRNLSAYEGLFRIYLKQKELDEAREVIDFLTRLNPASYGRYMFDFAYALFESGGRWKAWKYAKLAYNDEPSNPRYLDFLTELAILDGNKKEARQYLDQLKEVNPENGKIQEFEERLK